MSETEHARMWAICHHISAPLPGVHMMELRDSGMGYLREVAYLGMVHPEGERIVEAHNAGIVALKEEIKRRETERTPQFAGLMDDEAPMCRDSEGQTAAEAVLRTLAITYCNHNPNRPLSPLGAEQLIADMLKSHPVTLMRAGTMRADSDPRIRLCGEILDELDHARTLFPGKNVTFAALVEEVGELAKATFEQSREQVRKEAIQVAVMAMRVVLDGDHTFDHWRAEKGLDPLLAPAEEAAE